LRPLPAPLTDVVVAAQPPPAPGGPATVRVASAPVAAASASVASATPVPNRALAAAAALLAPRAAVAAPRPAVQLVKTGANPLDALIAQIAEAR